MIPLELFGLDSTGPDWTGRGVLSALMIMVFVFIGGWFAFLSRWGELEEQGIKGIGTLVRHMGLSEVQYLFICVHVG